MRRPEIARSRRIAAKFGSAVAVVGLSIGMLAGSSLAVATPTQEDVDNAKAEVAYAEMTVAQLEIQLASAEAAAQDARIEAAIAMEEANQALIDLDAAIETAKTAAAESVRAQEAYEAGLKQLAGV